MPGIIATIRNTIKRAYYAAAKSTRLNVSWGRRNVDAHRALVSDRGPLAARGAQLFRDTAIGRSVVQSLVNKALPTPIEPRPKIQSRDGRTRTTATEWNRSVAALWFRWAHDQSMFSLDGRTTFPASQRVWLRHMLIHGEVFIVRHVRDNGRIAPSIRIEVVDPTHLDTSRSTMVLPDRKTRPGIDYDTDGRPVRYWFRDPNLQNDSVQVDAKNVIHLFVPLYAGQQVGEPFSATVGELIHHFQAYYLAEVQGAQNAARVFGMLHTTDGNTPFASTFEQDMNTGTPTTRETVDIGDGELLKLFPGEDFKQVDMRRPGNQFAAFVEKTLKLVSAASGIPYESLSGDYAGSNYSVARMTNLVTETLVRPLREEIKNGASRLYDWFIDAGVLAGQIKTIPGVDPWQLYAAHYTMPSQPVLEPDRAFAASELAMKLGLQSWSEVVKSYGGDPDELLAEIEEDRARLEAVGLPYPAGEKDEKAIFQYHIENGVVSINDVRTRLGLPNVPGGDALMVPRSAVAPPMDQPQGGVA